MDTVEIRIHAKPDMAVKMLEDLKEKYKEQVVFVSKEYKDRNSDSIRYYVKINLPDDSKKN